jgi:hypothetical protein
MTLMVKMEGRMQKLEDEQENGKTALTGEMKQLETKMILAPATGPDSVFNMIWT